MSTGKTLKVKKTKKPVREKAPAKTEESISHLINEGEFRQVPILHIEISPFNYRKDFPKEELKELAADISRHGVISNLTVRPLPSGRYELVVGERRLKAAGLAGLKEVPANVVALSDQEAMEIQLSENSQRSDPHPMREALAIGRLQEQSATIAEIAVRIGKSKAFVYTRLKLLCLIEPFRQLFLAGKCSAQQAFEIAAISPESQAEFYEEDCADWQTDDDFEMPDTKHTLDQFKYDLKNAPFDIRDKKLVPEAGACTACPFNMATIKTLFPELATEAVCSKKECYQNKCRVSLAVSISKCFQEHKPNALLFYGSPEKGDLLVEMIPEAACLPRYNYHNVRTIQKPQPPERADYVDEQESENDGEDQPDGEAFELALQEYGDDVEQYKNLIEGGKYLKGILVSESRASIVFFDPEGRSRSSMQPGISKAADFQAATKAGGLTPALVEGEMNRIRIREERAQQLDREKLQLKVHEQFESKIAGLNLEPSPADLLAVRLVLFQSLGFSARNKVLQIFFEDAETPGFRNGEELYRWLENLTGFQFAFLIHVAIASNPDSRNPNAETGYFLYKMAEQAGLDLIAIEQEQREKTDKRQEIQRERMAGLQKQMGKMQSGE